MTAVTAVTAVTDVTDVTATEGGVSVRVNDWMW